MRNRIVTRALIAVAALVGTSCLAAAADATTTAKGESAATSHRTSVVGERAKAKHSAAKAPAPNPVAPVDSATNCGVDRGLATYHGTNAARELHRAVPDPLKVVNTPCDFPADVRGLRIDPHSVSLVAGGKLLRSIPTPPGVRMTLPYITRLVDDPSWIVEDSPGVYELKTSLVQEAGTKLLVAAPAVKTVRLDNATDVTIGGSEAVGTFDGVTVTSWNPRAGHPVLADSIGRPFVLYENDSTLNIVDSTMQYLGSDETSSYGVAWRVGGTNGLVDHSLFQDNFFGAYTFEAAHVTFENSIFRDNVFYGIDPHTNSSHLTILDNTVYGNLDHGIVFSRYVTDSVVSGNHVYGNKVNGIMMDYESNANTITGNIVQGNHEGIVLSGSSGNNVYGNTITGNAVGIRASHNGAVSDNIHNNLITGGQIGIQLYDGAAETTLSDNTIKDPARYGMVIDAAQTTISGDTVTGTPTGEKIESGVTINGGTIQATKLGIEVTTDGFADVNAVHVQAPRQISKDAASVVILTNETFTVKANSGLTWLDKFGIGLLAFALFCEVLILTRSRALRRFRSIFRSAKGDALGEHAVHRRHRAVVRLPQRSPVATRRADGVSVSGVRIDRSFRPDIEGLRLVAVGFVVLAHASLGLPGGYVGVDIFFVISGFLITQQLLRERDRTGRTSFSGFYARRARRILPAASLVTVVTLTASYKLLSPLRMASVARDGLAAAVFGVNWRLAAAGTNYFNSTTPPSPFQHYWSLSVEEQFYVVWPVLIVLVGLAFRRRFSLRARLTVVLVAIVGASLWASIYVTPRNASYGYFGTHTRAWELAAGALVAVWSNQLTRLPQAVKAVAAWLGLGAMIWTGFMLNSHTTYPGAVAQIPVYGAALLIAAGCGSAARGGPEALLARRPFQSGGRISYSLYLWHWPILILLPAFLGYSPSAWQRGLAVLLAIGLSALTFVLLEKPVRQSQWLVERKTRAAGLGGILVAGTVVASLLIVGAVRVAPLIQPAATPTLAVAVQQIAASSAVGATIGQADPLEKVLQEDATATQLPADVQPTPAQALNDYGMPVHHCMESPTTPREQLPPCNIFGSHTGRVQLMLIGDSHAGMWLPAFSEIARAQGWKLVFYARGGCPIADYPTFVAAGFGPQSTVGCNAWRQQVIAAVQSIKPDVLIVTNEGRSADVTQSKQLGPVLQTLKKSAGKVVWLADTPLPQPTFVAQCLAQHPQDIQVCNVPAHKTLASSEGQQLDTEVAESTGAAVIDPTPWFCTSTVCPAVIQNTIVYIDDSHITAAYALLREPQLSAALVPIVDGK